MTRQDDPKLEEARREVNELQGQIVSGAFAWLLSSYGRVHLANILNGPSMPILDAADQLGVEYLKFFDQRMKEIQGVKND